MSEKLLTEEQAFLAMYSFLEEYFSLTNAEDIGALLGSMALMEDGTSADAAIQQDWEKAVNKALSGKVQAEFELKS